MTVILLVARKVSAAVVRCDFCGGELKSGQTTLEIWRGAEMLVIKDVPGDVCEQCNEAYISADVSERRDHFLSYKDINSVGRSDIWQCHNSLPRRLWKEVKDRWLKR